MNKLCSNNIFNILSFLDPTNKNYIVNKKFDTINGRLLNIWTIKFLTFQALKTGWIQRNPKNKMVKLYRLRMQCEMMKKKIVEFLVNKKMEDDLVMFNIWVNMYNDYIKRYNKLSKQKNKKINSIQYTNRYLSPIVGNTSSDFSDDFNGWGYNYDYEL